jgi:hypothetical protein
MLRAGDSTTGAGLALLPNTSSIHNQHSALSGAVRVVLRVGLAQRQGR